MQAQRLLNKPQGSILRRVVGVVRYEYVGLSEAATAAIMSSR
jgi:hypothetical protein